MKNPSTVEIAEGSDIAVVASSKSGEEFLRRFSRVKIVLSFTLVVVASLTGILITIWIQTK